MVSERITHMDFSRREIEVSKTMCVGCNNGQKGVKKAASLATARWVGSCLIRSFVWAVNDEFRHEWCTTTTGCRRCVEEHECRPEPVTIKKEHPR